MTALPAACVSAPHSNAALLTAPGPAAIATIRVIAAPHSLPTLCRLLSVDQLPPRPIFRTALRDAANEPIDDILAVVIHHDAQRTILELHLHGNPWLVERALHELQQAGFERTAAEGAFGTAPADALEAAAWAALPQMLTSAGVRWLLTQPARVRAELQRMRGLSDADHRVACRALLHGLTVFDWFARSTRVALLGRPNAGKSTLMNRLAGSAVSIVSPVAGTTRDWIEAASEHHGYPLTWIDTAGVRDASDELERESIRRTESILADVDAVILVVDGAQPTALPLVPSTAPGKPLVVAWNKCDLSPRDPALSSPALSVAGAPIVPCSATTGAGVDDLVQTLLEVLGRAPTILERPGLFCRGHAPSVLQAADSAQRIDLNIAQLDCG
ncbi:MAG: GTP-binding protein [Phycisphaerae bacterium]|nr:GTP-binding protein [Phycisphaerae bacterium]